MYTHKSKLPEAGANFCWVLPTSRLKQCVYTPNESRIRLSLGFCLFRGKRCINTHKSKPL